jgi:arsenate reductase
MKVLFICVENTCRSQIAEGFARSIGLDAGSAGVRAGGGVNPAAVQVMSEVGVDISDYHSKAIDYDKLGQYDVVISMCSLKTTDICPSTFIGTLENWNINDPKGMPLDFFRSVRDLIREKVLALQSSTAKA